MELPTIDIAYIIFLAVLGIYLMLLGFILTWVYHDAEQRGLNGWVITSIAFFTGTIFGTLAWLVFRPNMKPQPIPVRS
jgi:uncharacterized membrane protein